MWELLRSLAYYRFRIEFDGTGMVRVVLDDDSATTWAAPLPIILMEMLAFVVGNEKAATRRKKERDGDGQHTDQVG